MEEKSIEAGRHGGGSWTRSPFLGPQPEALALLQASFVRPAKRALVEHLERECERRAAGDGLRCQMGVGPTFYERPESAGLVGPRRLAPLQLNLDEKFGLRLGSGESDLVVILAGGWSPTIDAAREFKRILLGSGLEVDQIHVGHHGATARDHTGFLDSVSNLQELAVEQFQACVFVQPEDDPAFAGGSYLVFRKYEEDLEMWNDLPPYVQEQLIGRRKKSGSFLDGSDEWTKRAATATERWAHIRRVNPLRDAPDAPYSWTQRIYRRGIKFAERKEDGVRHGLLFLALVRDPEIQFRRIHNERLLPKSGVKDHFMTAGYISPMTSACYYLPADAGSLYGDAGPAPGPSDKLGTFDA